MTVDHRKFLRGGPNDAESTPAEQAEFEAIVQDAVLNLCRATRGEVNAAIHQLLLNPTTKTRVGPQLIERLPAEIERRLES